MKTSALRRIKLCVASISLALTLPLTLHGCGGGGDGRDNLGAEQLASSAPLPDIDVPVLISDGIFGAKTWDDGSTISGGQGKPIGNINCLVNENYHIHSHLTIIREGRVLAIPKNIGLQGCAYEVHTHDATGYIHIETQSYHRITLGDFFAVWGQPLSETNVANLSIQPIAIYIVDNGKISLYKGNPADIELLAHREITIVLGNLLSKIPTFQWPSQL